MPVLHKHGEDPDYPHSEGEEEVNEIATQGSDIIRDRLHTWNRDEA